MVNLAPTILVRQLYDPVGNIYLDLGHAPMVGFHFIIISPLKEFPDVLNTAALQTSATHTAWKTYFEPADNPGRPQEASSGSP